jgi:non-homologous end joining protein Ku
MLLCGSGDGRRAPPVQCDEPIRLRQKLVCPNNEDHAPIVQGEVRKWGKEIGGEVKEVTAEEIAAVRANDPEATSGGPKTIDLTVVRTAGLIESTLNGDLVYRLRPNAKTTVPKSYELLRRMTVQALRTGKTLVGPFSVGGGSPRLFALTIRHGQVVAQSLMWPDDVAPFDEITDIDLAEKIDGMVKQAIDTLTVDFDPAVFRNQLRERAEQLIADKEAAAEGGATVTTLVPRQKAAAEGDDLESLLAAMIA